MLNLSSSVLLALVCGANADLFKTVVCIDGVCTATRVLPKDANPDTDCFTVEKSVPQNEYKEIDFSQDFLPSNFYSCIEVTGGTSIGKQGFKGSKFDTIYLPHTVTDIVEMAFKEVTTINDEPLQIVQLCDPSDESYTEVNFFEKWAEKTDPTPVVVRECNGRREIGNVAVTVSPGKGVEDSSSDSKSKDNGSMDEDTSAGRIKSLEFVAIILSLATFISTGTLY